MFAELSDDDNNPSTPTALMSASSMHDTFGRHSRTGPRIVYKREELLRLRESPLVGKPEGMAELKDWLSLTLLTIGGDMCIKKVDDPLAFIWVQWYQRQYWPWLDKISPEDSADPE